MNYTINKDLITFNKEDNLLMVLVNNDDQQVMKLDNMSSFIFQSLLDGIEQKSIINTILLEYEVDIKTATKDFESFLESLLNLDLIQVK